MSDGTKIEWTDATWNVVNGCTVHSPGCANCYAMLLAAKRLRSHPSREGLARMHNGHAQWTGEVRFNEKVLLEPLRWKRPRKIFVCAHGDLFHEKVPDEWIDRVFAVMALAPQHQFQVLTKRADRMRQYAHRAQASFHQTFGRAMPELSAAAVRHGHGNDTTGASRGWPLPNVWLGVSVEDQQRADERIPVLLDTPAALRWLSCEPLLEAVDLSHVLPAVHHPDNRDRNSPAMQRLLKAARDLIGGGIDWVVAGGESGRGARPMHPDWARQLRDACASAGVPFLFKQWGEWGQDDGPPASGRDRIFEGSARAAVMVDGAWRYLDNGFQGPVDWCKRSDDWLFALGKKAAGRHLDGQLHDGFPA